MNTKYYSNIQENAVAKYLNWKVVPGSGARDFNKGDIYSNDWLGECKTHASVSDCIFVYFDVWNKISQEAMSVIKSPVLFVDDGSQEIAQTWCILKADRLKRYFNTYSTAADNFLKLAYFPAKSSARFDKTELRSALEATLNIAYMQFPCTDLQHKVDLAILHISDFKKLLEIDSGVV